MIKLSQVYDENQTRQWRNWLDQVWFVTKTRQDNDLTNRRGATSIENETELSWSIRLGVVYD